MATTITHYSERNALAIYAGHLDGPVCWSESCEGTRSEVEHDIRELYGLAGQVDRNDSETVLRYPGFTLTVR
jgi:hypothetical protein